MQRCNLSSVTIGNTRNPSSCLGSPVAVLCDLGSSICIGQSSPNARNQKNVQKANFHESTATEIGFKAKTNSVAPQLGSKIQAKKASTQKLFCFHPTTSVLRAVVHHSRESLDIISRASFHRVTPDQSGRSRQRSFSTLTVLSRHGHDLMRYNSIGSRSLNSEPPAFALPGEMHLCHVLFESR